MGRSLWLAVGALATACAPDIALDVEESALVRAEFDPAGSIVPFPNDLLRVHGRVSLPAQCHELPADTELREGVLNTLDGFGASSVPLTLTFTEPVNPASLEGRVWLFDSGQNPAAATPVPVEVQVGEIDRWDLACAAAAAVSSVTIVPALPLRERSTYAVAVLDGVTTANGERFLPTSVWALVRDPVRPVEVVIEEEGARVVSNETPIEDLDTLVALSALWASHAPTLAFLDVALARWVDSSPSPAFARGRVLSAWSFTTQTVVAPLDPAAERGPAAELGNIDLSLVPASAPVATLFEAALGTGACTVLPCTAVASVLTGTVAAPRYQARLPSSANPFFDVPGSWDHPLEPTPMGSDALEVLAFVPSGTAPASGWPVVIFGHGLGGTREQLFAIAAQMAEVGLASLAIDWVAHGSRAVRIDTRAALGCDGEPEPVASPHCFAPLWSTDLTTTRDNLRQSALDVIALRRALAACAAGTCPDFAVDGARIGFLGQSLGGILGGVVAATADIEVAVLNTGGVGWLDILVYTETPDIKCPLVDALIDAGVITGGVIDKWSGGLNPNALCLSDLWMHDPGFVTFAAAARWVLDAAEPALFAARLAQRPVLVQQVVGDPVVPNVAQEHAAALLGLTPTPAAVATGPAPVPTEIVGSAWITYTDIPADTAFPGNGYHHRSLVAPAAGAAGELGSAQMQADAIDFLARHLLDPAP